jgi:hypothetical protein
MLYKQLRMLNSLQSEDSGNTLRLSVIEPESSNQLDKSTKPTSRSRRKSTKSAEGDAVLQPMNCMEREKPWSAFILHQDKPTLTVPTRNFSAPEDTQYIEGIDVKLRGSVSSQGSNKKS